MWYNRDTWTVKDLLILMVTWQREGYLDPEVWNKTRSLIDPEALPADIHASRPSVPQRQRSAVTDFAVSYLPVCCCGIFIL